MNRELKNALSVIEKFIEENDKPELRERWLLAKPDHILPSTHESRHEALIFRKTLAEENGAHFNEYEPVLFREVQDD